MGCIKCGKKTKGEQTFCPHCLEVMEQYPVPSDVHVQLPTRPAYSGKKASRKRRPITDEEKVRILHRRLRRMLFVIVILTTLLAGAVYMLLRQQETTVDQTTPNGQNFTVDETLK